jgi:hypothetical protein
MDYPVRAPVTWGPKMHQSSFSLDASIGSVALADPSGRETGTVASPRSASVFSGFRFRGR